MPKTDKELLKRDAKRDLGAEILEGIRQIKRGKYGRRFTIEPRSPIVRARLACGLSQAQFARLLGVSVRTLQEWEQGRREPAGAAKTLIKIVEKRPEVLQELT